MPAWKDYQEEAATVFRDLGFTAETDVSVEGVRNRHDVDVLATYEHAGLKLTWIIECKHWKSRVTKERVLTLRAIVEDVGADRGVMLAENGYQAGAIQATYKSNMVVTSLSDLRAEAARSLVQRRLLALPERLAAAHARYWDLPKSYREESGLRPEGAAGGYSGGSILLILPSLIVNALAGTLPPQGSIGPKLPVQTKEAAADVAETLLVGLEMRLTAAEESMPHSVRQRVEGERKARVEYEAAQPDASSSVTLSVAMLMGEPIAASLGGLRNTTGDVPPHTST